MLLPPGHRYVHGMLRHPSKIAPQPALTLNSACYNVVFPQAHHSVGSHISPIDRNAKGLCGCNGFAPWFRPVVLVRFSSSHIESISDRECMATQRSVRDTSIANGKQLAQRRRGPAVGHFAAPAGVEVLKFRRGSRQLLSVERPDGRSESALALAAKIATARNLDRSKDRSERAAANIFAPFPKEPTTGHRALSVCRRPAMTASNERRTASGAYESQFAT